MTDLRIQFDDDFLVCVICEKLLNEPRLLPCLHSVCLSCAQSALVGSIMKIRCLKCKEYVTVSDSKNIPSNQWLQNVIDIMNISECSEGMFCTFCELNGKKHEAVARCMTCFNLLCQECWEKYHTFTTQTRNHKVVSLTDLKSGKIEIKSEHPVLCPDHDSECFRYFCRTCNLPICRDCIILQHKSHDFITSKQAIEKVLHLEIKRIEKDISHLKTQHLKMFEQSKDIIHFEINLNLKIQATCNSMINNITDQRKSLERKLTLSIGNTKEKFERETTVGAKIIEQMNTTLTFCQNMLRYGNNFENLILQKTVLQRMIQIPSGHDLFDFRDLIPKYTATWKEPHLKLTYAKHDQYEDSALEIDLKTNTEQKDSSGIMNESVIRNVDIGVQCDTTAEKEFYLQNTPKETNFDMICSASDEVVESKKTLLIKCTNIGIQCNITTDHRSKQGTQPPSKIEYIRFKTSTCLSDKYQRPKISCVSWSTDDSFLAIDQSNNKVHFFTLTTPGNPMTLENPVDCTVSSWCFAIRTGSSEIFVFERNSLSFLFRLSNFSVVTAASPLSPLLACISKCTISIKSSKNGSFKCLKFRSKDGLPFSLGYPRYGCVLTSGKFVVSDFQNEFVYFFDENAVLFRKEFFCSPGSIVVDTDNSIYIADFFAHSVIVTNFEGSFREMINLKPHVIHPRSISISPDYKLAVAFENNVYLFQLKQRT